MSVIRAADAPQFHLPGITFSGLAAPSRGSAELCTWRLTVAPRLASPEAHTIDRDEVFTVLTGAASVTPGGETLQAGDAVVVPAGQPILLVNPTDEPAELYVAIGSGFTAKMADGTPIGTPPWAQ